MSGPDPIRDCAHGHQRGKCDTCALLATEARIIELEAQLVAATDCSGLGRVQELQAQCAAMRAALDSAETSLTAVACHATQPSMAADARAQLPQIRAALSGAAGRELLEVCQRVARAECTCTEIEMADVRGRIASQTCYCIPCQVRAALNESKPPADAGKE